MTAVEAVHELVSELDYPMFIVPPAGPRERAGCLVGFATQCSIHPPRFLLCLSEKNRTFRVARESDVVVVHLVPGDAAELADPFGACAGRPDLWGAWAGDEVDKSAGCAWSPGPGGAPVLRDCPNWFAGRILDRL